MAHNGGGKVEGKLNEHERTSGYAVVLFYPVYSM